MRSVGASSTARTPTIAGGSISDDASRIAGARPKRCGSVGAAQVRGPDRRSVAVVIRLVRTLDRDADVVGLLRAQLGELDAELLEVKARDLLVELLRQHVDL